MRLVLVLLMLLFAGSASAADTLTAKEALREINLLERAFEDLHPGLYRYQTPDQRKAEFAAARLAVADGATPGQMYLLASRLSASVRCGHTWTNPLNQGPRVQALLASLPALPFDVRIAEGRMGVMRSMAAGVAAGDEVLAIDGRTVSELVALMLPYLRADGSSDGKRVSQLESTADGGALDRLLPLLFPPGVDGYAVKLRDGAGRVRTVLVPYVSVEAKRVALPSVEDESWRLRFDGDVAVLTLPTFAFWGESFDWKAFLAASFKDIAGRGVTRLVIDLRQNEGGDDAIGRELLSYLIAEPYTVPAGRRESAYERVPYDLARYLDTWNFGFFDRTGKVEKTARRSWVFRDVPAVVVVEPRAGDGFSGRSVLLTGPRMSSAGFLFARDAQANGIVLVGAATGGNLRGLNGGELAWVTLPYSGVAVDVPLVASVYDGAADSGVLPDVAVVSTLEDLAAGRDAELSAALALLHRP